MSKHEIEITIELQSGAKANLLLSPDHYKQSFRDFRKRYDIADQQALRLKNIIQFALVQISKMKFQTLAQNEAPQKHQKIQPEQHDVQSPRFKKMPAEEQAQSQFSEEHQSQVAATQNKEEFHGQMFIQKENTANVPLISVQDLKNIRQEDHNQEEKVNIEVTIQQKIVNLEQEKEDQHLQSLDLQNQSQQIYSRYSQPQDNNEDPQPIPAVPPLKLQNLIKHEASLPTGLKQPSPQSQSHRKLQNQTFITYQTQNAKTKIKKKNPAKKLQFVQRHSQSQIGKAKFDRLYYQQTDSFKSKKNQQIDRKQLNDFIEVQKYELNNRLKRTTKDFFFQLHNRKTECWEHRINSKSKEKSLSEAEKNYTTLPSKKISIDKAFKGSIWESRSRCQANIYEQKLSKQKVKMQENRKAKQVEIKKRIKQQRSNPKSSNKKVTQYRSRSCQKCSPKKIKTPKNTPKIAFKSKQRQKKSYISDILIEAYQQRMKQMKTLNIQ